MRSEKSREIVVTEGGGGYNEVKSLEFDMIGGVSAGYYRNIPIVVRVQIRMY